MYERYGRIERKSYLLYILPVLSVLLFQKIWAEFLGAFLRLFLLPFADFLMISG